MGLWSSNANLGNLGGAGVAALIYHSLDGQPAWSALMLVTAGLMAR